MSLHVVGTNSAGQIRHTVRNDSGTWQAAFGDIESQTGEAGHFTDTDCCLDVNGNLHVCGVTTTGKLLYTRRNANGTWQVPFSNVSTILGFGANVIFKRISCTSANGELYVWGVYDTGTTASLQNKGFSGILRANNVWQDCSSIIPSDIHTLSDVSACTFTNTNVVLFLGLRNVMLATGVRSEIILHNPGQGGNIIYQVFVPLISRTGPFFPPDPQYIKRFGATYTGGELNLAFVTDSGNLYHLAHGAQVYCGNIEGQTGEAGTFVDVACGTNGTELHIVATNTANKILHTIRFSYTSWQRFFGDIEGASGEGGNFISVGAS